MTRGCRAFVSFLLWSACAVGLTACESNGLNPTKTPGTTTSGSTSSATGFTWVKGSNAVSSTGTYGFRGLPAAANAPAARSGANAWQDKANRRVWLFGGLVDNGAGVGTDVNDLWVFDESTERWTWVDGAPATTTSAYGTRTVSAATNRPPGRASAVTWMDSAGNLWLFGGTSTTTRFNDVWRYQPSTAQWTWITGSSSVNQFGTYGTLGTPTVATTPGARFQSASWVDGGYNLWLFGGYGFGASGVEGFLNDFWRLDATTLRWTWVGGVTSTDALGNYGIKGTAAAPNYPGARRTPNAWVAHDGIFWMFGGQGYGDAALGTLNDVWSYSITSGSWTWQAGATSVDQPSVAGTLGVEAATTTPGGTAYGSATWTDADGLFWFFGGEVASAAPSPVIAKSNDFWRFNPTTRRWSKVYAGTQNATGVYGTAGTPRVTNVIGSREGTTGWVDIDGTPWIFGGYAVDAFGTSGLSNDLWKVVR